MKALEVDFVIPPILEESINNLIQEVNNGGLSVDCWQDDVRASINICLNDETITEDDADLLRKYYYRRTL